MPAPTKAGTAVRAGRVGASEVGALLGPHPYTTPLGVYGRINGLKSHAETPSMRTGSALEPAIAHAGAETLGLHIRACARTYAHPVVPLAATPDYLVIGAPGLLEVKLTGDYGAWVELPEYVAWQARAQLACTDRERVHVVALVGSSLRTFVVERDEDRERQLLEAVRRFDDEHLRPGIPPAGDDEPELLLAIRPAIGQVGADDELVEIGDALAAVTAALRSGERREAELRAGLLAAMAARDARLVLGAGWRAEVRETSHGPATLKFAGVRVPMD